MAQSVEEQEAKYWKRALLLLRRHWSWNSPQKKLCLAKVKTKTKDGIFHQCQSCNGFFSLKNREIQCDHIIPIGNTIPKIKKEFLESLEKMECPVDGLQALCKICHDYKSALEKSRKPKTKRKIRK